MPEAHEETVEVALRDKEHLHRAHAETGDYYDPVSDTRSLSDPCRRPQFEMRVSFSTWSKDLRFASCKVQGDAIAQHLLLKVLKLAQVRHLGDLLLTPDIDALLADRRQDHLRYPVLEGTGVRLVGAHDEPIQAALGDKTDLLRGPSKAPNPIGGQTVLTLPHHEERLRRIHFHLLTGFLGPLQVAANGAAKVRKHEPHSILKGDSADVLLLAFEVREEAINRQGEDVPIGQGLSERRAWNGYAFL